MEGHRLPVPFTMKQDYWGSEGKFAFVSIRGQAQGLPLHRSQILFRIFVSLYCSGELKNKTADPFGSAASSFFSSPNHPVGRTFHVVYYLPEPTRKAKETDKPKKLYRNPVFVAEEWQKRMEEQGLTRAELARELGISKARVSQMLNILKLPEEVLVRVRDYGDPMEKRLVTERELRKSR